ncbi:cyclin-dependent protein kinase inhibitor SMR9 [Manihot esculenta]|uniref:Cyclin-dependent protein kinase inhibitor SMR13 n=1 Tax=Manihot esculenta TaxID=3983 RepID=A0A2C9VTW0_MANES|nr:cyclin-dependent protein kinase inhibitor SMR9 [Manihot esculenta]OAY48518.1 hypothetical protein MANES_06G164000v8 [Manihot esculenta]
MAPSAGTRRRNTTRKPRRTHYKKRLVKSKSVQEASVVEDLSSNSSSTTTITNTSFDNCSKIDGLDFEDVDISTSSCSTPKAQRFRLPEIVSCPPAPKKQRVISNCSLQRKPIAFFAPPDIELFFFFALRDISV